MINLILDPIDPILVFINVILDFIDLIIDVTNRNLAGERIAVLSIVGDDVLSVAFDICWLAALPPYGKTRCFKLWMPM